MIYLIISELLLEEKLLRYFLGSNDRELLDALCCLILPKDKYINYEIDLIIEILN